MDKQRDIQENQFIREVAKRIQHILNDNDMSANALANQAGMPPSTVYSILNGKCKDVGINTLWMICEYGFETDLAIFFSDRKICIPHHPTGLDELKKYGL